MTLAKRSLMNEEQLKTWVMRQLGAPRVKVELDRCHLEDAFEDALDWYLAYKGVLREKKFDIAEGQVAYDPPEDADTIIDVILPAHPYDLSVAFASPFGAHGYAYDSFTYDVFDAPDAGGFYSSLYQAIQYNEMAKRVLSSDFNWMWNEAARKIIVSPVPCVSGTGIIQYKSNCITVDQLNAFDHRLVKEYMLARAMIILGGRIRGKYGSFPTAQGEREIRDAEKLEQKGWEEIERLTEELRKASYPMAFVTG